MLDGILTVFSKGNDMLFNYCASILFLENIPGLGVSMS
jgi:hypothetical protein